MYGKYVMDANSIKNVLVDGTQWALNWRQRSPITGVCP